MLEFWLARDDGPPAMCRVGTGVDPQCRYSVDLPRPQACGGEAPHVDLIVTARGMLLHVMTRVYFGDAQIANAADAALAAVPPTRRHTLIAKPTSAQHYHFDVRLQGRDETVFFEL